MSSPIDFANELDKYGILLVSSFTTLDSALSHFATTGDYHGVTTAVEMVSANVINIDWATAKAIMDMPDKDYEQWAKSLQDQIAKYQTTSLGYIKAIKAKYPTNESSPKFTPAPAEYSINGKPIDSTLAAMANSQRDSYPVLVYDGSALCFVTNTGRMVKIEMLLGTDIKTFLDNIHKGTKASDTGK